MSNTILVLIAVGTLMTLGYDPEPLEGIVLIALIIDVIRVMVSMAREQFLY